MSSIPIPEGGFDRPPFRTNVLVIGTGFGGLAMAIRMRQAGVRDFVLLERALELGGTWRDNVYPGCACDIPSVLYSFSFEPKSDWSRAYPTQPEIRAYLDHCAHTYRIGPHIRYGKNVVEARYDEAEAVWRVVTDDGDRYVANVLVSAMGGLSNPHLPEIPGLRDFAGPSFHSATWRHDVPLDGRDVAVVGTGASAIQFVPQIAPFVGKLTLFQRTPPWILPKLDGPVSARQRALRRFVPGYRWLLRKLAYWTHEIRAIGFTVNPKILAAREDLALGHLRGQVPPGPLRDALTPDYRMGCKRVLISNDYYPAVRRANVELVTDAIDHVERDGVVTRDGVHRRADVIVYGTGFLAQEGMGRVRVVGVGGRTLDDAWRNGMEAFLGVSVAGFPNFFTIVGPNTGLGHNSMVFMIESHVNYIMSALRLLKERRLAALDVRDDVQRAFNAELRDRMAHTVWNSGCRSWYLDANGRNTTLWPGFTFDFRRRTYRIEPKRYHAFRLGRGKSASNRPRNAMV